MANRETLTLPKKDAEPEPELTLPDLSAASEEVTEAKPEKEAEPEQPEADPVAEKAMKMGWKPKDNFDGDPDTWVDAAEFIRREPLFEQIRKQKKRADEAERNIRKLADHNKKIEELSFKRALDTLKQKKVQALEEGDHKRAVEIDDEIAERRANAIKPPDRNPFDDWVKENQWYEDNPEMADMADRAGLRYKSLHPEADAVECFEYALKAVKKQYPTEFGVAEEQPQRQKPRASAVESGRSQAVRKTYFDKLDHEEQQFVASMSRTVGIDREEYAKQVIETRGK